MTESRAPEIALSVVAPAHNEQDNIGRLLEEVERAGAAVATELGAPGSFEFIVVDDGSTDGTRAALESAMAERPWLRVVAMTNTPPRQGQRTVGSVPRRVPRGPGRPHRGARRRSPERSGRPRGHGPPAP